MSDDILTTDDVSPSTIIKDKSTINYYLDIDTREHKLKKDISSRYKDIVFNSLNLDIGDVHIHYKKGSHTYTFIIERKTISDCLASIKDNRYKEQKLRCKSYVASNSNTKFFYILEGDLYTCTTNIKERQMVHGFIISNNLRDNIQILHTTSLSETVDLIARLLERVKKNYKEFFKLSSNLDNKHKLKPNTTNNLNAINTTNNTNSNLDIKTDTMSLNASSTINSNSYQHDTKTPKISVNKLGYDNTINLLNGIANDNNITLEYNLDKSNIKLINIIAKTKNQNELFMHSKTSNINSLNTTVNNSNNTSNIDLDVISSIKEIILNFNSKKYSNIDNESLLDDDDNILLDDDNTSSNNLNDVNNIFKELDNEYLKSRINKKKKDNLTPKLCQQLMLTNIPGISSKYAIAILEHYKNINTLITLINDTTKPRADIIKELTQLTLNTASGKSRKLGPVLSSRIVEYLAYS
jgi:ERCC4-type nuclease